MIRRTVVFSPEAAADLVNLYDRIVHAAGGHVALGYLDRIERFCLGLDLASERGHRRDDIRPGLRIVGFEKRVTVAFVVGETEVTILRLFLKGRDWEADLP